ncbi:hypothetical protein CRENBAI_023803 [Crenichthys baileyi]|uniref:Uncharacterized protein n=1 Tax=Crenichthys baileyi TaxID=28760 RepID=A0AAV9SGN9_9TELE
MLCPMGTGVIDELLGTPPWRSGRESPFFSCLQPHDSEIKPRKYQIIAHLLVHPSTLLVLLKRCHSEDHTERESVLRTSLPLLLPNTASVGKLTSSNKHLSTAYSKQTSFLSFTTCYTIIRTNNNISPVPQCLPRPLQ